MITLYQISEKILRDERMTLSSCPWAINSQYAGTPPIDLETERRRTIYEAVKEADRDLRRLFHMKSPKTLIETVTVTMDANERPFPIPHMRYIELALDSSGRHIPVVGYASEPALNRARWKLLGYSFPLRESSYRILITRPGYWKLSPAPASQAVTVKFIREHGFGDVPIWYDEGPTTGWTPSVAPVVTVNLDSTDWITTIFGKTSSASAGGSTRFDFAANGAPYLLAYYNIESTLSIIRPGYNFEFWIKTSFGSIPDSVKLILSTSATCATETVVFAGTGMSAGGEWYRYSVPITAIQTGLKTLGIKINTNPVTAGQIWLDNFVYTQPFGNAPLYGPDEYNENLLVLKARAILNRNAKIGTELETEVQRQLLDFAMSDGSGEKPRRLIVRVP